MPRSRGDKLVELAGRRVSEIRRTRGWTQERFAARIGKTSRWVARVEAGQNLTLQTVAELAHALGVAPPDLLTDVPPDPSLPCP